MEHKKMDLEPEMMDQEIRRYYLDDNGLLCERTEVIKVPTGRLIPVEKQEPAQG